MFLKYDDFISVMAEESMQEALAQQKAQCPFCKIIAGEIPSQKVFESETELAILDIHPSMKGHTLLLPKEHYPLLPLVPLAERKSLFEKLKYVTIGVKKAMLTRSATVFIASGAVAGQQAPHLLIHIIPRERDDGLVFETQTQSSQVTKEIISQNRQKLQKRFKAQFPSQQTQQKTTTTAINSPVDAARKQKLASYIQQNPTIKKLIQEKPAEFEDIISQDPNLQELFEGISVSEFSKQLQLQENQDTHKTKELQQPQKVEISKEQKKNIASVLENDEDLRQLLLDDPKAFREKVQNDSQLTQMFRGVNIEQLSQKLREAYNE